MKNTTQVTVISGLGPGDEKRNGEWRYAEVAYELNGERSEKKHLMAQALCELLPRVRGDRAKVQRVVFVGAPKVEEIWWKSGLLPRGFPGIDVDYITTPDGKTLEEFWEISSALAHLIEADLSQDPDTQHHYYLDLTPLGYRIMPLFVAAALQQAIAGWSRYYRKSPPKVSLLYGAWEGKHSDGSMPIWDLTDLITSGNWDAALTEIHHAGRADSLQLLAQSLAGEESNSPALPLTDAARSMCQDLTSGRLHDLLTRSVPALLKQVSEDTSKAIVNKIHTLQGAIDDLHQALSPLQADDIVGPSGLQATAAFARLGAAQGRYADSASALREALITHHGRSTRKTPMISFGSKGFNRQRERIASELFDLWNRTMDGTEEERAAFLATLPPALRTPLDHLRPLEQLQSDLTHLGLEDGSFTTNQVRDNLNACLQNLASLLEGPLPPAVFINLSETPLSTWSEEQIAATQALGCGEAVELIGGIPELDPDADETEIERLAHELASRAIAQGAAGVGVGVETDPSLSFALVAELQTRGIQCFAPRTRKVSEEVEVQGALRKVISTRFARWSPIARPTSEE